MDSIFEQPRATPRPQQAAQNFQAPVVPEASLIFQNEPKDTRFPKPTQIIPPHQQSYNAWRLQNLPQPGDDSLVYNNKPLNDSPRSDNICQNYADYQYAFVNKGACDISNNKSMLKKVRFEGPQTQIPQSHVAIVRSPNFSALLKNTKVNTSDLKVDRKPQQYTATMSNTFRFPSKLNTVDDSLINMYPKFQTHINKQTKSKVDSPKQVLKQNLSNNSGSGEEFQKQNGGSNSQQNLFERSTLNSEAIKKFALPDHIIEQEKIRVMQNCREPISERKMLPNYSQPILPDRMTIPNKKEDDFGSNQNSLKERNKTPIDLTDEPEKTCKCDCRNKSDNQNKENLEPENKQTVSELLNIVKVQNEQLQLLQSQVEMLIKLNEKNRKDDLEKTVQAIAKFSPKTDNSRLDKEKVIEKQRKTKKYDNYENRNQRNDERGKNNVILYKDEQVGTSYDEGICRRITKGNIITKDTKNEKISVGIMTSFQVRVKSPFNKNKNRRRIESTETTSTEGQYDSSFSNQVFTDTWQKNCDPDNDTSIYNEKDNDYSLDEIGLEPLNIQEPPLSPNHTVHVDMQDYFSDSEDESSSEEPGWTFYNNILGQVNNLLENSPSPNSRRNNYKASRNAQSKKSTDRTMEIIKQATLQNLKEQGLCGSSKELADMNPSEISFAVKQILMKYMSDEELATIAQKQDRVAEKNDGRPRHYQQEHRNKGHQKLVNGHGRQSKPTLRSKNANGAKILDITTLKKQPKLL